MNEKKKLLKRSEKILSFLNNAKESAVKLADQNDDRKFDLSDVSLVGGNIGQVTKSKVVSLKENLNEINKDLEKKSLKPIFIEDLEDVNFLCLNLFALLM